VRHVGDPVVALASPSLRGVEEAAALVTVDYEELPAVFDPVAAAEPGAPLVHETHAVSESRAAYFGIRPLAGTNVCHRFRLRHGDVAPGFAEADVTVEETFRIAAAQHCHMEPHACVASWDDGSLTVWTGTQKPHFAAVGVARILGLMDATGQAALPPLEVRLVG